MSAKPSKTRIRNNRQKKIRNITKEETKKEKKSETEIIQSGKRPDVIVDFEYDEGMLFIIVENIGNDSAYDMTTKFNKKILGIQKTIDISSLEIFQSLKFLPPGKKIRIFIDSFQFYLTGKQPLKIGLHVFFKNKRNESFQNSIQHDLSIYKDFVEFYQIRKIA